MNMNFDFDVAKHLDTDCAIILANIEWWTKKNKANERNLHDGYYWTYNSVKAWNELFPYLSEKKIRASLNKLEKENYIKTGEYNKSGFDRTKWYTFLGKNRADVSGSSICPNGNIEVPNREIRHAESGTTIPDINTDSLNTDINTDINPDADFKKSEPSLLEIEVYEEEDISKEYFRNVKNEKVPDDKKSIFEITFSFYELFKKNLKESGSSTSQLERVKYKAFTDPIRLMIDVDGVSLEQFRTLYKFLQTNDFWKSNILSTNKLRQKAPQLLIQAKNDTKQKPAAAPSHGARNIDEEYLRKVQEDLLGDSAS